MKLDAFDSSYFHDKIILSDEGFQIMFVYHPKFNTLELKRTKPLVMLLVSD